MRQHWLLRRAAAAVAAVAALLAARAAAESAQLCASPGATSVVLSVSTRRNATGHWNIAVDVQSDADRRLNSRPHERGVALTLGQHTALCNLTDSVHLFATASGTSLKEEGYMQWDSGQPSGGTSHNCGIANAYGRLMTHPCTNRYAYICEFGA
ncbi:Uncharacterized protein GBIM_05046 [Gryllus bimaculatus]|nr:Uncharacterized protein GBIM_05046 [Gryllus bimaculatus]